MFSFPWVYFSDSWFCLKLHSHPVVISQMTRQVSTWMYASSRLGVYLSTLQSSLEAAVLFALFVFPVLNYASAALPISKKGRKKLFWKPHFKFCHTAFLGEKLYFYLSVHPSISAPIHSEEPAPVQFKVLCSISCAVTSDTGSHPDPAMAETKEEELNPRSPQSQESTSILFLSFLIAKVFMYLIWYK